MCYNSKKGYSFIIAAAREVGAIVEENNADTTVDNAASDEDSLAARLSVEGSQYADRLIKKLESLNDTEAEQTIQ